MENPNLCPTTGDLTLIKIVNFDRNSNPSICMYSNDLPIHPKHLPFIVLPLFSFTLSFP